MSQKTSLSENDFRRLEDIVGQPIANRERLERALTHSSARAGSHSNYERLEFLGDRVLGLVIAEMLFSLFPMAKEGELSVRLNRLVSATTCAAVADELQLHQYIRTGSDVKSIKGKRMTNVRADVMESLIAAIYLDAGLDAARSFITRYWEARARDSAQARRDAKTELQEWAHSQTGETPRYTILERTGPDHDPHFTVQVETPGNAPETGRGRSRRIAEQDAATRMLEREGVWQRIEDDG